MTVSFPSATATTVVLLGVPSTYAGVGSGECRICSFPGSSLRVDVVPEQTERSSTSHLIADSLDSQSSSWTCAEWDDYLEVVADDGDTSRSTGPIPCLELLAWLERKCCDGLPPLYACETAVEEALLGASSSYARVIAPVTKGTSVDVEVWLEVSSVRIADFGIGGGAVVADTTLTLSWIDPRLSWNSTEARYGCTSVSVLPDMVWVPKLFPSAETQLQDIASSDPTVLSDGTVIQSLSGSIPLPCVSRAEGSSKLCTVDFIDAGRHARYHLTSFAVGEDFALPEYKLNASGSGIVSTAAALRLELDFVPLVNECNVCGYNGASKLVNGTIVFYPQTWLEDFPSTEGYNCTEIDSLLQTIHVADRKCLRGRAYYEEACCDDERPLYQCESSIHDEIVETYNTVTTPDPSPREDDPIFASKDAVDVQLSLDVKHIIGIHISTNSMEILVSMDLEWYDERLAWEPFIGGCNRVSYRASSSAEETEIWVPNIELVNKIEGVHQLPDSRASVRYDGHVKWRRTGVLRASCDLSGIEKFPYDTTSCFIEFGGTRHPLYDRVVYNAVLEDIEYADRLKDDSFNYQEYKLVHTKTEIITRIERLSGFDNKVIRYQFFFERARNYYMILFVLLYILFTYLSFGMFFIDYEAGERLGYGSSMLFVVVAQDITLSESTPVTQEVLWIYQLSFGSKIFTIIAIVQSVTVLFLYSKLQLGYSETDVENSVEMEERQSFLGNNGSSSNHIDAADESSEENDLSRVTSRPINMSERDSAEISSCNVDTQKRRRRACYQHTREGFLGLVSYILGDAKYSDSERRKQIRHLRMADMAFAIFFFFVYTIFVIAMFAVAL